MRLYHILLPFGTKSDFNSPTTNTTLYTAYIDKVQYNCSFVELPSVTILNSHDMLENTMNCYDSYQNDAPVYYYHPDHLGSTSWVTDKNGQEHQFLAYMPYGEPLLDITFDKYDCRYGQDDARYKFTGKERDAETGYDYVEQRYYWWPGGFWLRPDPLLDKYINLSPYAYCNGNPLKYVDPNGGNPAIAIPVVGVGVVIAAGVLVTATMITWHKNAPKIAEALKGAIEETKETIQDGYNKIESRVLQAKNRDSRTGLGWQNRQERKAQQAANNDELSHMKNMEDNNSNQSPDPFKDKGPKNFKDKNGKRAAIAGAVLEAGSDIAPSIVEQRINQENNEQKNISQEQPLYPGVDQNQSIIQ